MKILVLSDSHSAMRLMRSTIDAVKPGAVIHLGDFYDDGRAMAETYPWIPFYQVPGNCDRFRCPPGQPETMYITLEGVRIYMTHGHRHGVKSTNGILIREAKAREAAVVLYGHTHEALCRREEGMWVMNPGSCGHSGGTAGLLEVEEGKVLDCRILRQEDLETTG